MPSMTSESTRFLGHPKETNPIFIGTTQCSIPARAASLPAEEFASSSFALDTVTLGGALAGVLSAISGAEHAHVALLGGRNEQASAPALARRAAVYGRFSDDNDRQSVFLRRALHACAFTHLSSGVVRRD